MKTYKLAVCRTISVVNDVYIEAPNINSARRQFRRAIKDESYDWYDRDTWGECMYYQVDKAGPDAGKYEICSIDED